MAPPPDDTGLLLRGASLSARFLPAVAGKLVSLRSTASGREWLWRHPVLAPVPPVYGGSYVRDMDSGGWDEVFPSVAPARVEGLMVPDHGDAAQLPWEVVEVTAQAVTLGVTLRFAPCRLERRVSATAHGLRFDYTLTGAAAGAIPFLWCAHPLLALEPGMTLRLAAGSRWRCAGGVGVPADVDFAWPAIPGVSGAEADGRFRIPDSATAPFAAKLFSGPTEVAGVALETSAGDEALRFSWEVSEIPHLALWLNAGAWSGTGGAPYWNLGLEPTTSPCDSLAEAVRAGLERRLHPGATLRWSLSLELERPRSVRPLPDPQP